MSAESQKPEFVIIGQIIKPHGVKGAVKVLSLSDDPQRFSSLKQVFLGDEESQGEPLDIEKVQFQNGNVILTLASCKSREQAEQLRRQYVKIPSSEIIPLPDGAHYYYELVGLEMVAANGDVIGVVEDVVTYPANDVFVVTNNEREYLIPDIPDVIKKIDIDAGKIVINPMQGLLD